jgi:hypothetical protein
MCPAFQSLVLSVSVYPYLLSTIAGPEKLRGGSLGGALWFSCTRNNLNSVGGNHLAAIIHFEGDVFQLEGPDFVAETVSVQSSLKDEKGLAMFLPSRHGRDSGNS